MSDEDTRLPPSELVFSESLVQTIAPGGGGSESRQDAIKKIRERTGNIGNRLGQFIKDLSFLHESEYFERWSELWPLLSIYDKNAEVGDWQLWNIYAGDDKSKEAVGIGITLAQIPRYFIESNHGDSPRREDLVWGFLIGLVSQDIHQYSSEADEMTDIVEEVEKKITSRKRRADALINSDPPEFENGDIATEIQYIEDRGFLPTEPLLYYLRANHHLLDDNVEHIKQLPDHPYYDEYREEAHLEHPNPYATVYGPVLDNLEDNYRFKYIQKLREDLERDHETLLNPSTYNVRPIVFIRELGVLSEPHKTTRITPKAIADKVESKIQPQIKLNASNVGKFLNDLAGEGENTSGPNFDVRPLVNRTDDGPELTAYGHLLYQIVDRGDGSWDDLHAWAFSHTTVNDQLRDQIKTVLTRYYDEHIPDPSDNEITIETPATSDSSTPPDSAAPEDLTPPDAVQSEQEAKMMRQRSDEWWERSQYHLQQEED